jgi:fatty acid desaturase
MTPFDQAKARADEIAPAPADTPVAAAATAFGFGLLVIFLFLAIQWLGAPDWVAWLGAAAIYAAIAYGDCVLGWNRHKAEYKEALEELKANAPPRSMH